MKGLGGDLKVFSWEDLSVWRTLRSLDGAVWSCRRGCTTRGETPFDVANFKQGIYLDFVCLLLCNRKRLSDVNALPVPDSPKFLYTVWTFFAPNLSLQYFTFSYFPFSVIPLSYPYSSSTTFVLINLPSLLFKFYIPFRFICALFSLLSGYPLHFFNLCCILLW